MILLLVLLLLGPGIANAGIVEASYYTRVSAQREGTSGLYTANGERFNEKSQTCAHPSLPFGTILKVKNLENKIWIYCRVNDRGPSSWTGHGIDLTPAGFKMLKIPKKQGTQKVEITVCRKKKNPRFQNCSN